MIRKLSFLFIFFTLFGFAQKTFSKKQFLLGSPFEILVVANDSVAGNNYCDLAIKEVKRIENIISDWIPTSQVSKINDNAGIKPVQVDEELFFLIDRSLKISELTNGAFDISFASMDKIWKFDGSMKDMPSKEAIKNSVANVGFRNIQLNYDSLTVFLKNKGMKIGLGGIGQGYIADQIKIKLVNAGCTNGLVNVSGDINAWGYQPNGEAWSVGIVNPLNKNKVFAIFPLMNSSVETSGNYEKYVTFNKIRYSHIIDPRTGLPATGIISVSVFTKQTEVADAIATGVFVLGVDKGLNLINKINGVECIIVDEFGKIHYSENIEKNNTQKNEKDSINNHN
jgi:thiamine biosynthesis lipoprotein